jgi:hypothetical protein
VSRARRCGTPDGVREGRVIGSCIGLVPLRGRRWLSPDRLVATSGSAGGLLMGAVANMRPDLFRAIVADVPFADVINRMMDASLPLKVQEWQLECQVCSF